MERTGFRAQSLPAETENQLKALCRRARINILKMTSLAGSGHPGGSMSSIEIFSLLWSQAKVDPANPEMEGRDRIVVSHGHTSPGVYMTLGELGFFDPMDAVAGFRLAGSDFEGHIERHLPGIELTTGNLGQGLSAAVGMAIADRRRGINNHIWIVSGDGENQKGQISEARRFAAKYSLSNLTYIVDMNGLQISGETRNIMPVDLAAEFRGSGWEVVEADGHDLQSLYKALAMEEQKAPRLVLARTVMGKGVSFMENREEFHGRALKPDELNSALSELGAVNDIDELKARRAVYMKDRGKMFHDSPAGSVTLKPGKPRNYGSEHKGDNRSAWGNALLDIAGENPNDLPLVFDCDLAGSVKTAGFSNAYPESFFQTGIMEHHTASMAGGASLAGKAVFWSDFGVFAADETFNQHRLNDINHTNLKVVATHCGLDVGPDGKTHHCIKYTGLTRALPNCRTIVPADPNQTDRAIRFAASNQGNFFIAMGRSKLPIVTDADGKPVFGGDYRFRFGEVVTLREGKDIAVLALGPMCCRALKAADILQGKGVSAAVMAVSCPNALPGDIADTLFKYRYVATYEDHDVLTGLGASLALSLAEKGSTPPVLMFGVEHYGMSGDAEDLFFMQGLQPEQVAARILARF
ncbi:transketolase [Candidatus Fermentibacteria bacterium]|nr:MAG: transketolase [Candidatus Fermentibacteria bacterium]